VPERALMEHIFPRQLFRLRRRILERFVYNVAVGCYYRVSEYTNIRRQLGDKHVRYHRTCRQLPGKRSLGQ